MTETPAQIRKRRRLWESLTDRLSQTAQQLAAADQARLTALMAAQAQGLPIRQMAWALGLSPSRVHQLLHSPQAQALQAAAPTPGRT